MPAVLTASFVAEENLLAGTVRASVARSAGHASIHSRARAKRRWRPVWAAGGLASRPKYFSNSGSRSVSPVTIATLSRKISATARFRLLRNARLFPAHSFTRVALYPGHRWTFAQRRT